MPIVIPRILRTLAVLALLLPLSGCGYSLAGRGSFLPPYIKTIGVPLFTNATPLFDVDRLLTERVRSEFLGRGKYKVSSEAENTDAVLTGEISSIVLAPTAFDSRQQATRYALIVTAKVEFRDMVANKVLWANPAISFREEYDVTSTSDFGDPAQFFGQNVNALDRLTREFARSIVSAILEAF
jgi:outer membrane lipopolysaccharide assembly protein LptE/RlpB